MTHRLGRLSHEVPPWVTSGAVYHIRIRIHKTWGGVLSSEKYGQPVLESVDFYQKKEIWNCQLFLLMPDHLHALLAFNPNCSMSDVVGKWKHYHATQTGIFWQEGYFDHRIRSDESLEEKAAYIRNNPVVKGLCPSAEEWPWVNEDGVWM